MSPVKTIKTLADYHLSVTKNKHKEMVELRSIIPGLVYDLRYATSSNFTGVALYPAGTSTAWLRKHAALALQKVQAVLMRQGLSLVVFDAYRPFAVTVKFWELIHDERFVAKPTKGSAHNRGLAIDLSIINISTGEMLEMGTDFDSFSDTASHPFKGSLNPAAVVNRSLLKALMTENGFKSLNTEWWHFSWPDNMGYEVLDIPQAWLEKTAGSGKHQIKSWSKHYPIITRVTSERNKMTIVPVP